LDDAFGCRGSYETRGEKGGHHLNPLDFVKAFGNKEIPNEIKFAKINPNYTTGRPSVIYDIDILTGTLSKPLPYLASYTPVINDRVMVVKGVIIGKII
jgi:hypothetical protein